MTDSPGTGTGEALRHLSDILVERLALPIAAILLSEQDGGYSSAWPLPAGHLRMDALSPLLEQAMRDGKPIYLVDGRAQALADRALAVIPLRGSEDRRVGCLVAVAASAHPWSTAEVAALEGTAAAAAAELELRRQAGVREVHARRAKMLEQALEFVPVGVTITDREGRIVYTNPAEAQMHGYRVEELYGRTARSLAPATPHGPPPSPPGPRVRRWMRERTNLRSDGTEFPVRLWSDAVVEGDQDVGLITACADLSEWRDSEADLRRREEEFRSIVEQAADLILRFDADGGLAYLNPAAERCLELPLQACEGMSLTDLKDRLLVSLPWADALRELHEGADESSGEGEVRCGPRTAWLRYRVLREPGVEPKSASALVFASDVTESRQRERQLIREAERDPLTGLLNREAFLSHLERACAARAEGRGFAVLFLDLDRFKPVNDLLGHAAGDSVLVAVGERLRSSVRPSDVVGRLGGDEFAVLLGGAERESDAVSVVERIQRLLSVPIHAAGHELRISVSTGIALVSDGEAPDAVLRSADRAMYRAKAIGPGHYGILDSELAVHEEAVLDAKKGLRHAIEREQLRLHYQPIISLDDGRLVGLEALVRWQHPQRGLLGPQAFLPIAEETGLIVDLDRWVMRTAARQAKEWLDRGYDVGAAPISVNFSGRHMVRPDAVESVERTLADCGVGAECLMIEVTETSVMEDRESAAQALSRLRRLGIRICLDDFGTGYSSLAYLRQFPFDVLKIDRSFVQRIDASQADRAIVRSILALARTLGLHVTAEGVETARQRAVLRRLGCHQAQGFLIAEPSTTEEAERWLRHAAAPPPEVVVPQPDAPPDA